MRCRKREMLQNLNEERNCGQTVYSGEKYWGHLCKVWIGKLVTCKFASKSVAKLIVHEKFVDIFVGKTFEKCWKLFFLRQRNKFLDKMHWQKVLEICIVFKKLKCNFGNHPLQKNSVFSRCDLLQKATYFWKLCSPSSEVTNSTLHKVFHHL